MRHFIKEIRCKFFLKMDLIFEVRMIEKDLGKERRKSSNLSIICKVKEKLTCGGR